jgi:hypothetical protein
VIVGQQVARMRRQVRVRLTSRAVILRQTVVETETGNRIDYLPVSGTIPAGMRDPTVGSETVLAARVQAGSVVTVLLPMYDDFGAAVPVAAADRLAVTTTDPATLDVSTTTLDVMGVAGGLSDYPIVQRAVCQVLS